MEKNKIKELLFIAVSAFTKSFFSLLFFVGFISFHLNASLENPSPFDLVSIPVSIVGAWVLFYDFSYVLSKIKRGLTW